MKEEERTSLERKQEKEQRTYSDPNESDKFVNQRGKVICKYCSVPLAELKVTSTQVMLQDTPYMTSADRNGQVNFKFLGVCTHPAAQKPLCPPPPCALTCILGAWKNTSDSRIDMYQALLVRSSIPCLISGEDIIVAFSGQIATLKDTDVLKNLAANITTNPADVCRPMECEAFYYKNGDPIIDENIRWEVIVIGEKVNEDGNIEEVLREYKLEDVKLEDTTLGAMEGKPLSQIKGGPEGKFKLRGNNIIFNVPKEWGQKKVQFIAYIGDLKAITHEVYVRDHIVAAFYRINPNDTKKNVIKGVKADESNYANLIGPVHHHQGMYRTGDRFFVSGSTRKDIPSYVYMIDELKEGGYSHESTIRLEEGVLKYYRHAGGLQVAGNLIAVGIEAYNYGTSGAFGSAVHEKSVVCFFNRETNKEEKHLRIIKDENYESNIEDFKKDNLKKEKAKESLDKIIAQDREHLLTEVDDYASAIGLIFKNDNYYVVSRGKDQGVRFYKIDGNLKIIKPVGEEVHTLVGEFQNVNLHQNELGQVYMFGMGKSKMGGVDTCKIFEVDFMANSVLIMAVWINELGEIISKYYKSIDDNKLIFNCQDGTSFHWASCIHMEDTDLINKKLMGKRYESTDLIKHNPTEGFKGKFTIYTIDRETQYYKVDEVLALQNWTKDQDYYKEIKKEQENSEPYNGQNQDVFNRKIQNNEPFYDEYFYENRDNFEIYKKQERFKKEPIIPQFKCYSFTEDDFDEQK